MAQFDDHIQQARKNLAFLSSINQTVPDCLDWQVTVAFYSALHLVNAHLARHGMSYRKHVDVKDALNPEKSLSVTKLPEDIYVSYITLQSLSRRARYLVEEKDSNLRSNQAFYIYDKHLSKAIKHLNKLIVHFSELYKLQFQKYLITCMGIKENEIDCFQIIS